MASGSPSEDAGLRSQADSVPLDWNAVRAHLAAYGHRLDTDPPPRQFAGGLANLNYLIHVDGQQAVLRRPPMGELPAGAYDEFWALRWMAPDLEPTAKSGEVNFWRPILRGSRDAVTCAMSCCRAATQPCASHGEWR